MIFSMHCCLHLCGQAVSVGRLDQLLITYYEKDIEKGVLTPDEVTYYYRFVTARLFLIVNALVNYSNIHHSNSRVLQCICTTAYICQ